MLRVSEVPYLAWAKEQLDRPRRVCLVDSGLQTPAHTLGLDLETILGAAPPLTGIGPVSKALAARYGVSPEEVLPVLGTSMGIFLACAATLSPGDAVLVEEPGYQSLVRVPEALGARVVRFRRRREVQWALEPDRILDAWPPETKMVLVSDLHNPTGCRANDDALAELGKEATRRGAVVLVDEVYRDFRPEPPGTARRRTPELITVSSLTKVYGLGPLRLGWLSAPREQVERMRSLTNVLQAVDPAPQEAYFLAALRRAEGLQREAHRRARDGWSAVRGWSREHPSLRIQEPHGGIVAWVELPPGNTGTEVTGRLAAEGVTMVPGHFFGDDAGLRFSFSAPPAQVREGLEALRRCLG